MHGRQGCDRFRLLQRQGIAKAAPEEAYSAKNMRTEVVPREYARLLDFDRNKRTGFLLRTGIFCIAEVEMNKGKFYMTTAIAYASAMKYFSRQEQTSMARKSS